MFVSIKCLVAFILRGQPFHNAHYKIVQTSLEKYDKIVIILGSYRTTPTIKNPWTFEERKKMIEDAGGKLNGFELKWNKSRLHKPKAFMEGYPESDIRLVNKNNFMEFVMGGK